MEKEEGVPQDMTIYLAGRTSNRPSKVLTGEVMTKEGVKVLRKVRQMVQKAIEQGDIVHN